MKRGYQTNNSLFEVEGTVINRISNIPQLF
jgi:hypothetical protein